MDEIIIDVGTQNDGATFRLNPRTQLTLSAKAKAPRPASSVFVSYDTLRGYDRSAVAKLYGPIAIQIVTILTGLSEGQVQKIGFRFVDPTDSSTLYESRAAA